MPAGRASEFQRQSISRGERRYDAFTAHSVARSHSGAFSLSADALGQRRAESLGAPASATLAQVNEAIKTAGTARGWRMSDLKAGQIIGTLVVKNKHTAVVRIIFDTRTFSIDYETSENLNYTIERAVTYIHPAYLEWVDELKEDIKRQASAI